MRWGRGTAEAQDTEPLPVPPNSPRLLFAGLEGAVWGLGFKASRGSSSERYLDPWFLVGGDPQEILGCFLATI